MKKEFEKILKLSGDVDFKSCQEKAKKEHPSTAKGCKF
jgi:hypothetical protein